MSIIYVQMFYGIFLHLYVIITIILFKFHIDFRVNPFHVKISIHVMLNVCENF